MTRSQIALSVLCAALLLLLAGCFASGGTGENHAKPPLGDGASGSLYQQAADKILDANSLSLYISSTTNTTSGGQTFSKVSQQLLNFQNYGTDALRASMEETIRIGNYDINVSEIYAEGAGYFTVKGSPFTSSMTAEEYCARYTPAILFNTALYSDMQTFVYGKTTVITFRKASAPEGWAIPTGAEFSDASGYAVLNSSGELKESTYYITYKQGASTITQTTRVIIRSTVTAPVKSPSAADSYTTLEYPDAPRKLEEACGYLLQASQIQASSVENIACQAFTIKRDRTTSLSMSGVGDAFSAKVDINVNQINQSRGGELTVIQLAERFQNGAYSMSLNGSEATTNTAVDYKSMQTYCQDILVESILLTEYITGASMTQSDNACRITFQGSAALAEAICGDVCSTLYSDPTLLNTLASAYTVDTVECYLELDGSAGLPVASGLRCRVTHTIEGISYLLTTQLDQTYQYQ